MDYCDAPKFCPAVSGSLLRWSVAFYRGRRRFVIAWFESEAAALRFLKRSRDQNPNLKFDCLESLF